MNKEPISARVSSDIAKQAKERAELENVSLSAVIEMALEDYLALAAVRTVFEKRPAEQSESELRASLVPKNEAERSVPGEKPAWAIALEQRTTQLEQRVSQLERRGQGRKGERRR